MFLASSIALFAVVLVLVLWVRPSDIELGPAPNPTAHLEERKAAIYANLRDLSFEYRLGKLSDSDYEKSKHGLQEELAKVMAEIDAFPIDRPLAKPVATKSEKPQPQVSVASRVEDKADQLVCPHCNARLDRPMKFCGECGKPMAEVKV